MSTLGIETSLSSSRYHRAFIAEVHQKSGVLYIVGGPVSQLAESTIEMLVDANKVG